MKRKAMKVWIEISKEKAEEIKSEWKNNGRCCVDIMGISYMAVKIETKRTHFSFVDFRYFLKIIR